MHSKQLGGGGVHQLDNRELRVVHLGPSSSARDMIEFVFGQFIRLVR